MRGKLELQIQSLHVGRNIPAYAGKTPPRPAWRRGSAEHPRARGENMVSKGQIDFETGTSPRMRGKRANSTYDQLKPRNIPAHAGKTPFVSSSNPPYAEHPRACGENYRPLAAPRYGGGTSPRMRGKLAFDATRLTFVRNIPAHAGKTRGSSRVRLASEEHPRACGENMVRQHSAM